jgi:hypothetical protein
MRYKFLRLILSYHLYLFVLFLSFYIIELPFLSISSFRTLHNGNSFPLPPFFRYFLSIISFINYIFLPLYLYIFFYIHPFRSYYLVIPLFPPSFHFCTNLFENVHSPPPSNTHTALHDNLRHACSYALSYCDGGQACLVTRPLYVSQFLFLCTGSTEQNYVSVLIRRQPLQTRCG